MSDLTDRLRITGHFYKNSPNMNEAAVTWVHGEGGEAKLSADELIWLADRIDELEAAGTALLNAKSGEQVEQAESRWHRLMGWDDE